MYYGFSYNSGLFLPQNAEGSMIDLLFSQLNSLWSQPIDDLRKAFDVDALGGKMFQVVKVVIFIITKRTCCLYYIIVDCAHCVTLFLKIWIECLSLLYKISNVTTCMTMMFENILIQLFFFNAFFVKLFIWGRLVRTWISSVFSFCVFYISFHRCFSC